MSDRSPSMTARGVAILRAAHQLIDGVPPILDDQPIVRMFGPEGEAHIHAEIERYQSGPARALRSHVLLRSRFAEDCLCDAVARGVRQYLLLGAGFDTFAYRQPEWAREIRIVEIDQPASQAAKRAMLAKAGIDMPSNVAFADVDFERETLADGLRRCGVPFDRPTFFSWLGVTMYLTRDAIDATLATAASFPAGSEIALTFAQPPADGEGTSALADRAAEVGEPWISYFTREDIEAVLRGHGFREVEFLAREEAMRRYYAGRRDGLLPPKRVSILRARR